MLKSFFRRASNSILHLIAPFAPGGTAVRPFLHKLRGVKIYGTIFIGDQVYIEKEYPQNVEIHDGAMLVLKSTVECHLGGPGRIVIGKDARIGERCVISAHVGQTLTIGDGSVVAAGSVVTEDIPPMMFYGGVPAAPISRMTIPFKRGISYKEWKEGLVPLTAKD